GHFEVIGNETELQERAVAGWETVEGHTPHRPYVDAVKLECPRCKGVMGRIPDVGNPWLDAGIVPFSTLHYRSDRDYWQRWYPAEWITESFPGQFRNWFYSLLAMATVMEGSPPFLQNFGFATLLGENGQEMHKSLGNAIEFNEAADRMGVDVMRWLFINQKPENDLLFGYPRGDDARRRFLLPLWNVYSFFVTYANLDGWTPASQPSAANLQLSILDRWILARLDQVVDTVTRDVEASDFLDSGQSLEGFLDDLSNWYVRRSRRRFWKSVPAGSYDPDKEAAYGSLYQVLVRLALTLAPFTPFLSESIYQNLVRTVDPKAPESVHHCAWPQADLAAVDQELLDQMALARQVASLGLSARSSAGLKVRQPLAKCLVYTGVKHPEIERWWVDPSGGASPLREIVMDELNVKELEFVADPHLLVTYLILPDNKLLGPRFGAQFPRLRQTLAAADPAEVAARVQAGLAVTIQLDGQEVELAPAEILVQTQPAAGLAVAAEREVTVAIDTDLTPQLRAEGLAREIVRRVQAMRKDAGFEIADRITTYYIAGGDLAPVMVDWNDYVCAETLSTALVAGQPPQEDFTEQQQVDGETLTLGILKNN
ncbi:MAG TPA: DUF5915 domain-containing protein, partial [Anaerolineales bacterium]